MLLFYIFCCFYKWEFSPFIFPNWLSLIHRTTFFFFLILFIYFWLCWGWVLVAACALSLVAVHGLLTAVASLSRARALGVWAWAIVAQGLSCSAACEIFPDQGPNPCPLHWQADSQPLHHQGSPHRTTFEFGIFILNLITILNFFKN